MGKVVSGLTGMASGIIQGPLDQLRGKAPQISGYDMTGEARAGESQAIDFFRRMLSGEQPSIGQMAMQQNLDDAARQQMAFASSARGGQNAALAGRAAQQAIGQQQAEAARQSAIMQTQERQQAASTLGNIAAGQRGIGANVAGQNVQQQVGAQERQMGLLGNIGSAGISLLSDKNKKENIKKAEEVNEKLSEFLDALQASNYSYKGEDKKQDGIMAQDLEKSEIGEQMVVDTPNGKMVDFAQGFAAMLAAQAELNERIKKIEGKNGK